MNFASPRRSAICGGAFDVAEHDGDGAVGCGVRLQVGLLGLDRRGHAVDRRVDVGRRADALCSHLHGQALVHDTAHAQRLCSVRSLL